MPEAKRPNRSSEPTLALIGRRGVASGHAAYFMANRKIIGELSYDVSQKLIHE
jgi:hypothetical protein